MVRKLTNWIAALTIALLMMAVVLRGAAHAQAAAGDWHGAISIPAIGPLRIGVEIRVAPGGGLQGDLSSPDQTATFYPLADIALAEGALSFTAPTLRTRFEGRWDPAQQVWQGRWSQGGAEWPLTLAGGKALARLRPQTPAPPFPYRVEEVVVDNASGQVRLAGTLTLPQGAGPFPAAVLITGSGQQDRDETILGHKPFLVLADALTRRGVAVLRLDDRGAGGSTGDFARAGMWDFATDTEAAVRYLRTRQDIDAARVGLIGHSEGALIGPIVASRDGKIAFVVMMAGPGVPMHDLMIAQRAAVSRAAGVSAAANARNEALVQRAEAAMAGAKNSADAEARIRAALEDDTPKLPAATISLMARQLSAEEIRPMLRYDPRPTLAKLHMPVLALDGDKDTQVLADQNLPAIREALKHNRDATVVELPGLNHLFQTAMTGAPTEYATIKETISPTALDLIAHWVAEHTRR